MGETALAVFVTYAKKYTYPAAARQYGEGKSSIYNIHGSENGKITALAKIKKTQARRRSNGGERW